MRTHSGEKPFSCNQCNFSRTTASYLKIHIRTHSGGKPFMCDQCDYSSTQAQHLKTHILTHTGARPFTCNQCSYSCNRSDSMKRHMLSHTGEMPLDCTNLGKQTAASTRSKENFFFWLQLVFSSFRWGDILSTFILWIVVMLQLSRHSTNKLEWLFLFQ